MVCRRGSIRPNEACSWQPVECRLLSPEECACGRLTRQMAHSAPPLPEGVFIPDARHSRLAGRVARTLDSSIANRRGKTGTRHLGRWLATREILDDEVYDSLGPLVAFAWCRACAREWLDRLAPRLGASSLDCSLGRGSGRCRAEPPPDAYGRYGRPSAASCGLERDRASLSNDEVRSRAFARMHSGTLGNRPEKQLRIFNALPAKAAEDAKDRRGGDSSSAVPEVFFIGLRSFVVRPSASSARFNSASFRRRALVLIRVHPRYPRPPFF